MMRPIWPLAALLAFGCGGDGGGATTVAGGASGASGGAGGSSSGQQGEGGTGGSTAPDAGTPTGDAGSRTCPAGARCPVTDPSSPLYNLPDCRNVDREETRCVTEEGKLYDHERGGFAILKRLGDASVQLRPGEGVIFRFQYEWNGGEKIGNAIVRPRFFNIETAQGRWDESGDDRSQYGTTVAPAEITTDRQGNGTFTATAGDVPGTYTILASSELGANARYTVVVPSEVDAGPP